jgi:hypothetical protein
MHTNHSAAQGPFDVPSPARLSAPKLTAIALGLAVVLAVVLSSVGAQAAQLLQVVITDPAGFFQAKVDLLGNLRVADPGMTAFQERAEVLMDDEDGTASFDLPRFKRLVITHVSGRFVMPEGQTAIWMSMAVDAGGSVSHLFTPTFTGTEFGRSHFVFGQNTLIYADGSVGFHAKRSSQIGQGVAFVSVSGYLIDCPFVPVGTPPCN